MIWPLRRPAPSIRPLQQGDAAGCALLHATGFARGWSAQEFASLLGQSGVDGAAACSLQGDLLGFVLLRSVLDEAEVLTLIVARSARRRGLGRELMVNQLGRVAGDGVHTVFLEVDEANKAAVALYAGLGFEAAGVRPAYYPADGGGRSGALSMRLVL